MQREKASQTLNSGFDPIWDQIYEGGHEQKAPWDNVVSFVYRNRPAGKKNSDIRILEVGCGTASNLRFLSEQGFNVAGIEASQHAVNVAKEYFKKYSLLADIHQGSFDLLPFTDENFDLVVDRAALVHTGISVQEKAIAEIFRVLKSGGRFFYSPYADTHGSKAAGQDYIDGLTHNIKGGSLVNVGHLKFASRNDIEKIIDPFRWNILSLTYETRQDVLDSSPYSLHSSWSVIAEKI